MKKLCMLVFLTSFILFVAGEDAHAEAEAEDEAYSEGEAEGNFARETDLTFFGIFNCCVLSIDLKL